MAGTYQHYLQQMLQRGFKRPDGGKRHPSVWIYSKDSIPFFKRIENFGGEDEFYSLTSDGTSTTLDDKITTWESKAQADIRQWRQLPHGAAVEASKAINLIGLTGLRTKAARNFFKSLFQDALPRFGAIFADPDVLMQQIEEHAEFQQMMSTMLLNFVSQNTQASVEEIENSLEFKAVRRMLFYAFAEVSGHALAKAMRDIERYLQDAIDSGELDHEEVHKNALHNSLEEHVIREDLGKLNWFICENSSDTDWVLPDCAILQISNSIEYTPFLFAEQETRLAVVMPITPRKAVVGSSVDLNDLDLSGVTDGAIACSNEFFLSSRQCDELRLKSDQIGTISLGKMGEQLETVLNEFSGFRTDKETYEIPKLGDVQFTFSGMDIDEAHAQQVAERLMPYLGSSGNYFDLSRIKRVVVSQDIAEAYNNIEEQDKPEFDEEDLRRHVWWTSSNSEPLSYIVYVSYGVALVLADPDHEAYDFALNIFLQNLDHINTRTILYPDNRTVQEHLSAYLNPDVGESLRDIALLSTTSFLDTYYGCQMAKIEDVELDRFRSALLSSLEQFFDLQLPNSDSSEINNDRSQAITHALEELMRAVARYIATCHYARIETAAENDEILNDSLVRHNLLEWMNRLDFDFQRLRVNFHHPINYDDVKRLQSHAERLLWERGMVLVAHEYGGWLLPFADQNIRFANIREDLEQTLSAFLPENIADDIRETMKLATKNGRA